jgi:pyrroline-5-carboxylate reductase
MCLASDPNPAAREKFKAGIPTTHSNVEVVRQCDILVLAVKPQAVAGLLDEIGKEVTPRHLVISIAAGVTVKQIAEKLRPGTRIIRVMPNTPALVAAGAAGIAAGPSATHDDVALAERLFNAVGTAVVVPEHQLDAVTGLSGSGPAFVFVLIEALADGGVRMGLPRDVAQTLAAQTVAGAGFMVLETGQHPAALKDAVASPGGTTIAGLHALERAGFRAAAMDAVEAATRRAGELGKKD